MLSVMLDSGAFSVWKSGKRINIEEYAEYALALPELDSVVNLDVIPGKYGDPRTLEQVEHSAKLSWQNFEYLRKRGVKVFPVFHQGEDWKWLDRMITEGCEYIGLGAINSASTAVKRTWLDQVFMRLTNEEGLPIVRTHGFGMTGISLMNRYPWYSCDSVSWTMVAAYGSIMAPRWSDSGFDYGSQALVVSMSNRFARKIRGTAHFDGLPLEARRYIQRYVEREVGEALEDVQSDCYSRARCNIHYFLRYEFQRGIQPFRQAPRSLLFARLRHQLVGRELEPLRLFFVASKGGYSDLLNSDGPIGVVTKRLLSYEFLRKKKFDIGNFKEYLKTDGMSWIEEGGKARKIRRKGV